MNFRSYSACFGIGLVALFSGLSHAGDLKIKSGEKIAFLGDSITQSGNRKNGYIKLVMAALDGAGVKATAIPAGKAGNKSNDMLSRLDSSVLSKKPDWMLLSCGVNDVWHFTLVYNGRTLEGVSLEDFEKNIREIVERAEKQDVKVVIMTASMITEDSDFKLNKDLEPYNVFLRKLAKEKNLLLADINAQMQAALKEIPDVKGRGTLMGDKTYQSDVKNKLTGDGVHMNKLGNQMMAMEILRAFGMDDKQVKAAAKKW